MAKKTILIASLNTKVKQKVGLINKTELASIFEDMINEVYSDPIIDTDVTATHTSINDSVNYGYKIVLKKVGNIVFFNGQVFNKNINMGGFPIANILINNVEYQSLASKEFFFNCIDNNNDSSSCSVFANKFQFTEITSSSFFFNGTYLTNNN